MNEKMQELLNDEEFMKAFISVENPQELEKLVADRGIALEGVTPEEAFEIIKKQDNGEFSEEDLQDVSGGIAVSLALGSAALMAFGASNIAAYASYAYHKFKK